jgi:hypothetical protein
MSFRCLIIPLLQSKLVEAAPEDDETRRRRRSASSTMKLSSTQSFSASPQAELAASPSLKRAVRRTRPNLKPLPTPGQGDEEESGSEERSEDELIIPYKASGRVSQSNSPAPARPMQPSPGSAAAAAVAAVPVVAAPIPAPPVVDPSEAKKRFAELAKKYYVWVSEALEDMSFRDFGATAEEVVAFRDMLDESDNDIAGPSGQQYRPLAEAWQQLTRAKCDDAEPFSSLKLDDVEEMFASVLRAMAARRAAYEQHLESLRAREQQESEKLASQKRADEEAEKQRLVAEAESKKQEEEAKKQEEARKAEEAKKAEEEAQKAAPGRLSTIDFDISKVLGGLHFGALTGIVPDKTEGVKQREVEAMVSAAVAEPKVKAFVSEVVDEGPGPGDLVEAMWDQDGQWYRAKIEEITSFGFWVTFVEYGNSQDTAPESVRKLPKARAEPTPAPVSPMGQNPAMAASKLVAKKQKMAKGVAGPKKQSSAVAVAAPATVLPPSQQEPVAEDVRAPVGGIAARMAMLDKERQEREAAELQRKDKRLSGLEQRQEPKIKTMGNQLQEVLSKPNTKAAKPRKISSGSDEDDDDSGDDDDGDDEDDMEATPSAKLVVPVLVAKEVPEKKAAAAPAPMVPAIVVPPLAKAPLKSPRATDAFAVKSPRKKTPGSATVPAAAAAPPEPDPSAMSESERKLMKLREDLRKSREAGSAPKNPPNARGSKAPPADAAAAATAAPPRLAFKCLDGDEPMPQLTSADEILTVAMSAEAVVAPLDAVGAPVDLPARDKKRYEAVMALIDSERDYYNQLSLLMGLFVAPLRESKSATGVEVLAFDEMEELFGNAPTLWGVHKLFLHALIAAASGWTTAHSVTPVLELYAPIFRLYQSYTAHVGKGMVALTKFKNKHPRAKEFKDLVAAAEANPACAGTNLRSLLNMPVRRPSAYPPLARAIQRVTGKDAPEFPQLEAVCKVLESK